MRVAFYVRVSTERQQQTQTIEQQVAQLRAYVAAHDGWVVREDHIFRDDGYSGAKLDWPALDALRDQAARADLLQRTGTGRVTTGGRVDVMPGLQVGDPDERWDHTARRPAVPLAAPAPPTRRSSPRRGWHALTRSSNACRMATRPFSASAAAVSALASASSLAIARAALARPRILSSSCRRFCAKT